MRIDQGDFLLADAELSAALNGVGGAPNALGLMPGPVESHQVDRAIGESLDPPLLTSFTSAMTTLVAPAKVAMLHYTIADESISRSLLAWPADADDSLVALVRTGANRRVSIRTISSMRLFIARLLAANETLVEEGISLSLSTGAILVFLAIAEQLRMVRYHALQTHVEPATVFNQEEVQVRLASAGIEDFRWPLLFLDKVMPAPIADALTSQDIGAAIDELILAGLVDQVDETGQLPIYELAGPGLRICDALHHDVAKLALRVSVIRDDDEVGHEVMLLVRSGFDLFLFDLAGEQGTLASLGPATLEGLLEHALQPPTVLPAEGAVSAKTTQTLAPEPPAPADALVPCPSCGHLCHQGARFCNQCGAALAPSPSPVAAEGAVRICRACGHANRADSDFCARCGAALPRA
ncbi:MAG: zinc ribbon domain-containing protein [Dehalococcoidia bacterium]|nr:zinc ribbon domain-containing protein [Dehalococcoidia bacterium]